MGSEMCIRDRGKDSAGNEWFEAWETKDDAISSYYYRLAEAGEEI